MKNYSCIGKASELWGCPCAFDSGHIPSYGSFRDVAGTIAVNSISRTCPVGDMEKDKHNGTDVELQVYGSLIVENSGSTILKTSCCVLCKQMYDLRGVVVSMKSLAGLTTIALGVTEKEIT